MHKVEALQHRGLRRSRPAEKIPAEKKRLQRASPIASPVAQSQNTSTTARSTPSRAADAHSKPLYAESDFPSEEGLARPGRSSRLHPKSRATAEAERAAKRSRRRMNAKTRAGCGLDRMREDILSAGVHSQPFSQAIRAVLQCGVTLTVASVHRSLRSHARIQLDLAERAFVSVNVLL